MRNQHELDTQAHTAGGTVKRVRDEVEGAEEKREIAVNAGKVHVVSGRGRGRGKGRGAVPKGRSAVHRGFKLSQD